MLLNVYIYTCIKIKLHVYITTLNITFAVQYNMHDLALFMTLILTECNHLKVLLNRGYNF